MSTVIAKRSRIQQFNGLISRGIDAWVEAGQLLCDIVKDDADAYIWILSDNPHLTIDILDGFQRIGRKEIYPYLLIDGSPGAKALAALPYDSQVRLYNSRVRVLVGRAGNTSLREKRVSELTPAETARVFDLDKIRSVEQQRKMLAAKAAHTPAYRNPAPSPKPAPSRPSLEPRSADDLADLLTAAHDALLAARQALNDSFPDDEFARLDLYVANALKSVGQLRFALNELE